MLRRAVERGHRPLEAIGDELAIEDRPVVEDRQSAAETPQLVGERLVPEPLAALAATVPRLELPTRREHDEPADAVDLRLDRVPPGLGDRRTQRREAGVAEKLGDDVEGHERRSAVDARRTMNG